MIKINNEKVNNKGIEKQDNTVIENNQTIENQDQDVGAFFGAIRYYFCPDRSANKLYDMV